MTVAGCLQAALVTTTLGLASHLRAADPQPLLPGTWTLQFQDEFNGDTLDGTKWRLGGHYGGIAGAGANAPENISVDGGLLKIKAEQRSAAFCGTNYNYAAGEVSTFFNYRQQYGYMEARIKYPAVTGLWPAFWLMPDRGAAAGEQWQRQNTHPVGMELDIMEHLTRWGPYRYTTAMHWDGYGKNHKATGASVYFNPAPDGWITSGVLWLPGELTYYVNGKAVAHWKHDRIGDIPCEILFTMPIGGWDNEKRPLDAELPADFVIDYVRVWQRADLR